MIYDGEETAEEYFCYSLTDLTGDGFPELIMGHYDYGRMFPQAIFYYNETEGIQMRYVTIYYVMAFYEGGIIEYISDGVNYTVDYAQFKEDIKEWICIDSFLVETVIDGEDVTGGANYYRQEDGGDFFVNDSAEEIKEIVKARILAVAPYSKGEQSESALEQNRFFLAAEGLGIHYDVYEIGDYASGSFDLIIPFELFDMKEDMWSGRTT